MKRRLSIILVFSVLSYAAIAQINTCRENYVQEWSEIAISEMHRSGIPASITLAQGILESGCGKSDLAKNANNHFGIKCHKEWNGPGYFMDDDTKDECFRVYDNAEQSYIDHSEFLMTRSRYNFLFDLPKHDYIGWAKGLKKAGYATNPKYAHLLIKIIEENELYSYDEITSKMLADRKKDEEKVKAARAELKKRDLAYAKIEDRDRKIITLKEDKVIASKKEENKPRFNTDLRFIQEYENGIYLLNNIKTVKAETTNTGLEIARRYDVDLGRLYKYNDMQMGDKFYLGDNVFLQPKRNKGPVKHHMVSKGQSMHDISQTYGIKLPKLYELNLMAISEQAAEGEKLFLRTERPSKPKVISYEQLMQSRNEIKYKKGSGEVSILPKQAEHIVQSGESLFSISKQYGLSVDELMEFNGLNNNSIQIGQQLLVGY